MSTRFFRAKPEGSIITAHARAPIVERSTRDEALVELQGPRTMLRSAVGALLTNVMSAEALAS